MLCSAMRWGLLGLFLTSLPAHATCPSLIASRLGPRIEELASRTWSVSLSALEQKPSETDLSMNGPLPLYSAFRAWVLERVQSVDPVQLLLRQREIFARFDPSEVPLFDEVIQGKKGSIRQAGCLEASLLERHLNLGAPAKRGSEFGAIVLECDGSLEILFQSSESASVATSPALARQRDRLLSLGCKFRFHLHNHPFYFEGPAGSDIAGTTIPSGADRAYFDSMFREQGLQEAAITNGFSTWIVRASELD